MIQISCKGDRMLNERKAFVGTTLNLLASCRWTAMNSPVGNPYLSMWLTNHGLYLSLVCRVRYLCRNCQPCLSGNWPGEQESNEVRMTINRSIILFLFLEHFFSNISSWGAQDLFYCLNYSSISYRDHKQGVLQFRSVFCHWLYKSVSAASFRSEYAMSSSK